MLCSVSERIYRQQTYCEAVALQDYDRRMNGVYAADLLLLAKRYTKPPASTLTAIRSDLRWSSDDFEFTC